MAPTCCCPCWVVIFSRAVELLGQSRRCSGSGSRFLALLHVALGHRGTHPPASLTTFYPLYTYYPLCALQICAVLSWRQFGWRLYGKLGVDFREKGAASRMRKALQRNAYVTLLKLNVMLLVSGMGAWTGVMGEGALRMRGAAAAPCMQTTRWVMRVSAADASRPSKLPPMQVTMTAIGVDVAFEKRGGEVHLGHGREWQCWGGEARCWLGGCGL